MESKKIEESNIMIYHSSVKKSFLIISNSDSTGLSKLSWQTKKLKLRKTLGDGQRKSYLSNLHKL